MVIMPNLIATFQPIGVEHFCWWYNKLCGRPPQYAPPLQVDLWPFDLESGIRVTCDVGYICTILVFLDLSVLDLGPMYATYRRQISDRRQTRIIAADTLGVEA